MSNPERMTLSIDPAVKPVYLVSLGCSKNLVDGEYMSAMLREAGFPLAETASDASVIVVNTCGFIESAKKESIDMILEMADFKSEGTCDLLIVSGCLSERYANDMQDSMPEVDAILGVRNYKDIVRAIDDYYSDTTPTKVADFYARIYRSENRKDALAHYSHEHKPSTEHYAYLKIAEGCSNHCSFCAIPGIRGPFQSRPIDDVLKEAERLVASGYNELIVVAQDSGFYGLDIQKKRLLPTLLTQLTKIDDLQWIRVLYLYAEGITNDLIEAYKSNPKLIPYFDLPIQHASDKILRSMNRRETQDSLRNLIIKLREELPTVVLRTTVMVGYPGETEEDFAELINFISEIRFDRLGCFMYSAEEGTKAAKLPEQVDEDVKQSRYREVMELQQSISLAKHEKQIGMILPVKIEEVSTDGIYYLGRSAYQIPDVDPRLMVLNTKDQEPQPGSYYNVRIVEADAYELTGVIE